MNERYRIYNYSTKLKIIECKKAFKNLAKKL